MIYAKFHAGINSSVYKMKDLGVLKKHWRQKQISPDVQRCSFNFDFIAFGT